MPFIIINFVGGKVCFQQRFFKELVIWFLEELKGFFYYILLGFKTVEINQAQIFIYSIDGMIVMIIMILNTLFMGKRIEIVIVKVMRLKRI